MNAIVGITADKVCIEPKQFNSVSLFLVGSSETVAPQRDGNIQFGNEQQNALLFSRGALLSEISANGKRFA